MGRNTQNNSYDDLLQTTKPKCCALLLALTGCNYTPHVGMMNGEEIASTAESHIGSTDWAKDKEKGDFEAGKWKCNKFVYDVLREAGVTAPMKPVGGSYWPLQAADWANAGFPITDWEHKGKVSSVTPERGDVLAYL